MYGLYSIRARGWHPRHVLLLRVINIGWSGFFSKMKIEIERDNRCVGTCHHQWHQQSGALKKHDLYHKVHSIQKKYPYCRCTRAKPLLKHKMNTLDVNGLSQVLRDCGIRYFCLSSRSTLVCFVYTVQSWRTMLDCANNSMQWKHLHRHFNHARAWSWLLNYLFGVCVSNFHSFLLLLLLPSSEPLQWCNQQVNGPWKSLKSNQICESQQIHYRIWSLGRFWWSTSEKNKRRDIKIEWNTWKIKMCAHHIAGHKKEREKKSSETGTRRYTYASYIHVSVGLSYISSSVKQSQNSSLY